MEFVRNPNIDMTCLQGYIKTTYEKLVESFGDPDYIMSDFLDDECAVGKVTCEWRLKFADGTVASIYDNIDYKEKSTPLEEYNWHIGGFNKYAVKRVEETLL